MFARALERSIDCLVKRIVVPVTGLIPILASSGILLALYGALWLAFGVALAANPAALDDAWRQIGALPLPVIGLAWLLFLPPMAGLWVWTTSWPIALRLLIVAGLAGWNLFVFVPRRGQSPVATPTNS